MLYFHSSQSERSSIVARETEEKLGTPEYVSVK